MSVKVLVVDDSAVMRKIIGRSLNSLGVTEIVEAANGAEAVGRLEAQDFDLVLSDWNMPEKTGIELLREVRGAGLNVPFVLITTESEKERVVEAIQMGVSDYLIKPFDHESLRKKIVRFLQSGVCA